MALRQILSKRQQVENSRGEPLAGGTVSLYEPNTLTFITVYGDSGLVTAIPNPVPLSGSGRAEIWVSRDCDVVIEDRNGNVIVEELNANPDEFGEDTFGLVPNGSFEQDSDADQVPDGWTLTSFVGSNNAIDSTESTDGTNSFRFTSAGVNGGGELETTAFFPVNDTEDLRVNFDIRATAAVRNIVRVRWFDITEVFISNSDVYDTTATPVAYTTEQLIATPPANARFAKLVLSGGVAGTATSGSTYFDRVSVFYPLVVSGVFNNITIQDNEIISTNANGSIDIAPNGTGAARFRGTAPRAQFFETDAGADERLWQWQLSGGDLVLSTRTDVDGAGATAITLTRTATVVDSIALAASAITLNGVAASDFARLSQPNEFTAGVSGLTSSLMVSATNPGTVWRDTASAANNQYWRNYVSLGAQLFTVNSDDNLVESAWLAVNRTGTVVDSIALAATAITLNGVNVTDYARLSQPNTFTTTQRISATAPVVVWMETDAGVDEKNWRAYSNGGLFALYALNDAENSEVAAISLDRTGTTVDSIELAAATSRISGTASSTTAPAFRVGTTGATPFGMVASVVKAGIARFGVHNTTDGRGLYMGAETASCDLGASTNHDLRLVTDGGATILATFSTAGALRLHAYGAGVLTTDASGNVTAAASTTVGVAVKSGDTSRNATTVAANDPHLSVPVVTGVYAWECLLKVTTISSTPGLRLRFDQGTATQTGDTAYTGWANTGAGAGTVLLRTAHAVNNDLALTALGPTTSIYKLSGTVAISAGGTFTVAWAQAVSNANDVTLLTGSWLRLTRLS
jgi:hypothetical protein